MCSRRGARDRAAGADRDDHGVCVGDHGGRGDPGRDLRFLPKPFTPNEIRAVVRRATRDLVLSRQAKKLAAEQRRTRFELIRVLVHELKAPLGAVEGYLSSILDGVVSDEETLRRVVTRSIARIQGMRQLILDLLDVTRLEAGMKAREFAHG
jgi:two-component system sensor histidine kinase/response regulator